MTKQTHFQTGRISNCDYLLTLILTLGNGILLYSIALNDHYSRLHCTHVGYKHAPPICMT